MMSESVDRSSTSATARTPTGQRRLCVFARAPVLGQVKTRLAVTMGEQAALDAHIRLVEHTLARVQRRTSGEEVCEGDSLGAPQCRELWIAGEIDHPQVHRWSESFGFTLHVQSEGDLGVRMRHALNASSQPAASVLIGSDCPDIDADYLSEAFDALERADVVLGPSEDGGYGLIGVHRDIPTLFESISWSTSKVMLQTRARCAQLDLRCAVLPLIWDVDTEVDWRRFLKTL